MAKQTASQEFIPIKEIRDGVVTLKTGGLRAVLMTSSVNFSLKSGDEQKSVLVQFQNFLNSLDFTVQISVQSRALDIRPYLQLLEERYKAQTNELLKVQTREYINFVQEFTAETSIMAKHFYVVVPYTPAVIQNTGGPIEKIKDLVGLSREEDDAGENESFDHYKSQLEERVSVVEQGLMRTGVRTARLSDDELTELFYQTFNPGETETPIQ